MESKRPRNTRRQREAGAASREETRRRLLAAAGEEFAAVGYVAATVNRIAARADVSVQTLYLAWGSKRQLLRAYIESTLAPQGGSPGEHVVSQLDQLAPADAADALTHIARLFRQTAERSAVAWTVYRESATVDPSIAEDWQQLQTFRRLTYDRLLATIPDEALRLARHDAVDTAWVIASPESHELLVRRAGYSLDRFEDWLAATLRAALLAIP